MTHAQECAPSGQKLERLSTHLHEVKHREYCLTLDSSGTLTSPPPRKMQGAGVPSPLLRSSAARSLPADFPAARATPSPGPLSEWRVPWIHSG